MIALADRPGYVASSRRASELVLIPLGQRSVIIDHIWYDIGYNYKPPPKGKSPVDGRNDQVIKENDLFREPDVDDAVHVLSAQEAGVSNQPTRNPDVFSG